jgi:hypothetical protein
VKFLTSGSRFKRISKTSAREASRSKMFTRQLEYKTATLAKICAESRADYFRCCSTAIITQRNRSNVPVISPTSYALQCRSSVKDDRARGTKVACHLIKPSLSFTDCSKTVLIRLQMLQKLGIELSSPWNNGRAPFHTSGQNIICLYIR